MKRRLQVSATFVLVLMSSACIHKAGGAQVSAYEKALTYSTMLAQVNNTIVQGVIQAQQLGLLSVSQTNSILTFQQRVAADHKELTNLLADGPRIASGKASQIQAVITDLKTQTNQLISSGDLAIKNPVSQQTFTADANSVLDIVSSILASLQDAGVLK